METKLYNYLSKSLSEKDINFSNIDHQNKIENFKENSLGLNDKYIKKIIGYLKIYNSFLLSNGKEEVKLRYYQILALYYSEMYFENKDEKGYENFSQNALAYWMATGSGKTIVMHLNILQYLDKAKNYNIFQIILTTPGVNLIDQHREEIEPFIEYLNNIKYNNKIDLIIDTTSFLLNKGSDFYNLSGNKKIKRLILIDEAHIGTSSKEEGVFYKFRNELNKENSFLFEYSATYHNLSRGLEKEYENQIVYDYNYNLFYKDGYGKDFSFKQVGNDVLAGDNEDELKQNLDNCLLVISEKIEIWSNLSDYNANVQMSLLGGNFKMFPDKPLITFMGNTVNSKKDERTQKKDGTVEWKEEASDILNIVKYLANLTEKYRKNYKNVFNNKINGKLTITRNKSVEDELLLSYGDDGKYFGIINVGNGDKFFNDINFSNIDKKTIEIIDSKYLFKNIDKKESCINILIGSRKFSEGWNSFRVSVIALINLGSNAGNKIIQIFGRGVRLKGLTGDGKRKTIKHQKDYFSLTSSNEDKLIKIETLNVLSVKKNYLEVFTNKVNEEIKYTHSFKIKINPNIIKLNSGEKLSFEKYKSKLPIFKLSKKEITYKNIILEGKKVFYSYMDNDILIEDEIISDFRFNLDYRTDRKKDGLDIKDDTINGINIFLSYLDLDYIGRNINEYLIENMINLYSRHKGQLKEFSFTDVFNYIGEIKYDESLTSDLLRLEKTVIVIINDFLKKLKNKINHRINSKNIVYDKQLSQNSDTNTNGDFIAEYVITKEFQTEADKKVYIENIDIEKQNIISSLNVEINNHIYTPLLKEDTKETDLGVNISPDKLNIGEKVFIEQLTEYIEENFNNNELDFYLMRNIESLRSIGIYLESDEHPFFPDFVLWIIDDKNNVTYMNLIDPKGQDGIVNRDNLEFNDKAIIGNKSIDNTLNKIEEKIFNSTKKKVILNSFIILKPGSDLGTSNDIQSKMIENNVYKIDWYRGNKLNGKSYLDMLFEKVLL